MRGKHVRMFPPLYRQATKNGRKADGPVSIGSLTDRFSNQITLKQTFMEIVSNPGHINVGNISDIPVNSGNAQPKGPAPAPIPDPFPPLVLACSKQFELTATKTNPANAKIKLIPHEDSKFVTTSSAETAAAFRAIDANAKAMAAKWNATVPADAVAYATFSKVVFFDTDMDALLFVTKETSNLLLVRDLSGTHVWQSAPKAVYCRNSKLFVLHANGYSMMVDFGI